MELTPTAISTGISRAGGENVKVVTLVYRDFDVPVSDEELAIAERCAKEAVAENDCKYNKTKKKDLKGHLYTVGSL